MRDALAVLGVAGALLTVLFAARSAYLFVADRSVRAAELESWLRVARAYAEREGAQRVEEGAFLDISGYALERAEELDPGDADLEVAAWLAVARKIAFELDTVPFAYDTWGEHLPELTTEGWRLRDAASESDRRALLLQHLARLEAWQPKADAHEKAVALLHEASDLQPADREHRYRLALLLAENDDGRRDAIEILRSLVAEDPDELRFAVRLGAHLYRSEGLDAALPLLEPVALAKPADWKDRDAVHEARSLLYRALQKALAEGRPLPTIDTGLADELMSGAFHMIWSDKALAGLYWWQRGDHQRAVRLLAESDTGHRRQGLPRLYELELEYLGLPADALPPSLAEIRAAQESEHHAERIASIAGALERHVADVVERPLLGPRPHGHLGVELQQWPGEGLMVRRVVPGGRLATLGVLPGDWLIEVDGSAVDSIDVLMARTGDGGPASVVVRRDGTEVEYAL